MLVSRVVQRLLLADHLGTALGSHLVASDSHTGPSAALALPGDKDHAALAEHTDRAQAASVAEVESAPAADIPAEAVAYVPALAAAGVAVVAAVVGAMRVVAQLDEQNRPSLFLDPYQSFFSAVFAGPPLDTRY